MNPNTRDMFLKMVGGDEERFFREYWRKRTLFVESALPHLHDFYSYELFLKDYRRAAFHGATLLVSVDKQGNRRMLRVTQAEQVDSALERGMSVVLQALLLPENLSDVPSEWKYFVTLHNGLCDYLLPGFPSRIRSGGPVAAVDIFCTLSQSSSGGHYDTGDVFYFPLYGEKVWTVELTPDFDKGLQLAVDHTKCDLAPRAEHMKVRMRPGDCLYVPPYTYHRVCSSGKSLAVSLGMPTYTELALLRASLIHIQKDRALHCPLPSYPRNHGTLFHAAEGETRMRLLHAVDLLAAFLREVG